MSDPRLEKFPQDILALIGNNVICCDLERRNWNNVCKAFYHAYLKLILPNRPRNCLTAICYYTRICHTPPFFFLPCKPRNKFYRENFAELTKRVLREFLQSRCDNHTKGIFVAALRDRGVIFPAAGIMDLAWTCIPYSDLRYYGTIDKFVTEKTSKYSLLKRLLDCLFSSKNPPVENVETALKMFYCHCNYRIPWDNVLRYWHLSIKSGGVHLRSLFKFVRMDQLSCDQLADIMINTIRTKIQSRPCCPFHPDPFTGSRNERADFSETTASRLSPCRRNRSDRRYRHQLSPTDPASCRRLQRFLQASRARTPSASRFRSHTRNTG